MKIGDNVLKTRSDESGVGVGTDTTNAVLTFDGFKEAEVFDALEDADGEAVFFEAVDVELHEHAFPAAADACDEH